MTASKNEAAFRKYIKEYFPKKYEQWIKNENVDIEYCGVKVAFQAAIANKNKKRKKK